MDGDQAPQNVYWAGVRQAFAARPGNSPNSLRLLGLCWTPEPLGGQALSKCDGVRGSQDAPSKASRYRSERADKADFERPPTSTDVPITCCGHLAFLMATSAVMA
jgi:hypothetical protein